MAWIKTEIKLPKLFDEGDSRAIGEELINFIVERTKSGKGVDGKKFPKYSEAYKDSFEFKVAGKSSTVDLTLSGEMLDSLTVIEAAQGRVVIGFEKDDPNNDKAEGNILGSYGRDPDPSKARNFMDLSEREVTRVINSLNIQLDDGSNIIRNKPSEISQSALQRALQIVEDFNFQEDE